MSVIVRPKIAVYGDTGATFGGELLTDSVPKGDISSTKLNQNNLADAVEFNKFEETIKDFVLARLGHPVVRVELTPFQIKTCIDEASTKMSYHAPFWTRQFAAFQAQTNVGRYYLPSTIADNLNYVVYKKSLLATNYPAESFESDAFISFFAGYQRQEYLNMGDFYLLQQHLEQLRKILSSEGTWDLINGNILQLYPTPASNMEVVLEYRALDSATIAPAYRNWIQKYTLAIAKMTLGEIRSKYRSLPSPGGGAILNGPELKKEGAEERDKLDEQLLSEFEEPPVFTMF
jgi:hypothetical protein